LTKLKELFLCGCHQITDQGVAHIGKMTSLEYLILSGCIQISDVGLASLVTCTNMTHLNVMCCDKITDQVTQISKFKKLIQNKGVSYLCQLPKLQKLNLSGCVHITDTSIDHLLRLPLEQLNVMYCPRITNTGKQLLSKLSNLQSSELC
jgi:F-box/leucine-rich repeat protein 14